MLEHFYRAVLRDLVAGVKPRARADLEHIGRIENIMRRMDDARTATKTRLDEEEKRMHLPSLNRSPP